MVNNSEQQKTSLEVSLSWTERLGLSASGFGGNLLWTALTSYILFFYTDVIGVEAVALGTMMLFVRILDGGADIVMGILVDKTKTKYGKARPWIKWLAIPFGLSFIMLFAIPDLSVSGTFIYVTITYVLVNLMYTAIAIPSSTLIALVTKSQYERALLNIIGTIASTIASLVVLTITLPMVKAFGNGKNGWLITFAIFGIIAMILYFWTFFSSTERVTEATKNKEAVPLKVGVKALFSNKYWILITTLLIIAFLNLGVSGSVALYFTTYVMKNAEFIGAISIASRIPSVLVLAVVCAPLVKRFGKRNVVMAGSAIAVIGRLTMLIDLTSPIVILVSSVILGVGGGMLGAGSFAFLSDTVEYGEWKSGVRTEGLIFSASSFGLKVGAGLATAIVGWGLAYFGYKSGTSVQTDRAIQGIKFLYIWLPMAFSVMQIVILYFYNLDKIYPQIMNDLEVRNEKKD
ncbi:MFS transporter [Weissella diestrammenae]|uniref:MFS transporter n=1 Tax=Weissella diestrammenae TaxID=1162633 RepID=A0A7G9T5C4_9LACO|nr:glycoside-pentoside-hexuronide (GPH):cation symporter [Weissella diestrammenae]MCM0583158.1 MFS transporter [Weissella diestrammenae]QNN75299.1 MFS transporter [Weissella diestrammenae]